jgi:pantoate--beta-alanine ligase
VTRVMRDPAELGEFIDMLRRNRISCGFVPTMGALHEGHASLVRRSVLENDRSVVSVYVNPLQFGVGEDLTCYPRTLDDDLELCERERADVVFAPTVKEMQPPGRATVVSVRGVSDDFEGVHRPGHLDGVATIMARLLNLVRPHRVYFGQKDYQQTVVVRRMVADLAFPVEVVVCPTVRDSDGLALSSRNRYLTPEQREAALSLPRGLESTEMLVLEGERDGDAVRAHMSAVISGAGADVELEYAEIVAPDTLSPVDRIEGHAVLVAVLRLGTTRLLDNRVVAPPGTPTWEI